MVDKTPVGLGTDKVVWDLSVFYEGPDSAAVWADVERLTKAHEAFAADFRGKLGVKLGEALGRMSEINLLASKLYAFFSLTLARDSEDAVARKQESRMNEAVTASYAKHVTFFDLEVGKLSDAEVQAQMGHPLVAKHAPWIAQMRALAKYWLDEKVEQMLSMRSPYGPGEFADMMSELETKLRFELDGKALNLADILNVISDDRDAGKRARALEVINKGLDAQRHTYFAARTLNITAGGSLVNDDARGLEHPMQSTNLGNMVDDATVKALHDVVADKGAKLAKRYYKLKTRLLGMDKLAWSDRNAPMPFAPETVMDWTSSCAMVVKAYREFSPTLGGLVERVLDPQEGWVDAAPGKAKISGAFDYTVMTPEGVRSYMLLNHLGNVGDVMTLAHELGHAVHGLLASEAQGPLMWHAAMPYAETASIFGEMLTFESLVRSVTDPKEKLALYMDKMTDFLNTVVRQICFSEFEQGIYAKRREGKLAIEDFNALWMETTKTFYGAEGEVFTYDNTEHLWSYVSHFYSYQNFYVYAYAFGELFTQSLMATRGTVGERFEPLYLDLLRAGGTKDAVGLMEPFGLNPNERSFWEKGLEKSVEVWLGEAEQLAGELGL